FDTHPSVDKRIEALIKFAGGHDPGPLTLEPPASTGEPPPGGPWASRPIRPTRRPPPPPPPPPPPGHPSLPGRRRADLGATPPPGPNAPGKTGPWGPHN